MSAAEVIRPVTQLAISLSKEATQKDDKSSESVVWLPDLDCFEGV